MAHDKDVPAEKLLFDAANEMRGSLESSEYKHLVLGGGTPKSYELTCWSPSDVSWITPKDMTALAGTPVVWSGERGISAEGLRRSSARLLPAGSIVFTSRATIGLIAVTQQRLRPTRDSSRSCQPTARVRHTCTRCSRDRAAAIEEQANGSTFMEVNKSNFKAVPCLIPSQDALLWFDRVASPALTKIAATVSETRTLTAIRDALLPKLVSGQLRVPLSDDPKEGLGAAAEALDAARA